MKFFVLFIPFFLLFSELFSQDTLFRKKKLTGIDIEAFYSFYKQDGDHSAVTGGIGTESLHVNDIGLNTTATFDTSHTIIFETYFDVISSASVDNIDFVKSSASEDDFHLSVHAGYQYTSKNSPFLLGAKYTFGRESDYLSNGFNLWGAFSSRNLSRTISLSVICFFDDLRWRDGNGDGVYEKPKLIYPVELRYKEWFDIYRRNTYNFAVGYTQDINRQMSLQLNLGVIYQEGLLSTTFHRIYFADSDSVVVENLPRHRTQVPVSVGLNSFITSSWILKAYYLFYWDNFGIVANTIALEAPVKLNYKVTLYPFFRFYHQTASVYFKPYKEHSVTDDFYTSDYDLSAFSSYKVGMGFGFYPDSRFGRSRWSFNNLTVRYAYYWRTNQLDAHMISLLLGVTKN